ncbi:gliding motility-associated C-terminal domain-containing protein [Emticicia sp. BO119]|uniref:T9SS type B sorting domain-containing protein n=1 Tax=Emticicia sp. BO119 TaxID=2757768 RepID=UPI0015EFFD38|nr:gliding motility-associated C-terminal domain-containing protein [Emticicia sp. BO119]MBA4849879.1 gliding motility-associated C-terminal domain-containing protein [Emticicia sp. BO119]
MRKGLPRLFFALFYALCGHAQMTDLSNIGFEMGNTNGWVLSYGSVYDSGQKFYYGVENPGTRGKEHYVTSLNDGNDPKITAEPIPMVAPGSTHSIRIGNTDTGDRFARIRTSFVVTPDNTLFQYKFAVVLENDVSGHLAFQKPGFTIIIRNQTGQELTCNTFDVQLLQDGTADGFKSQGVYQYRPWTTGAVDLRDYVGQIISIEVTAHGCTKNSHEGYAYFDAQCLKSEIKTTSICPEPDGDLTLKAPDGFKKYTWSTGETTPTIKVKAKLGDPYYVKVVPIGSLSDDCELRLDYTIKYQDGKSELHISICDGQKFTVEDQDYTAPGQFIKNINRFGICDSVVTLNLTVNPLNYYTQDKTICQGQVLKVGSMSYTTPGIYVTKVEYPNPICDSVITTYLTVRNFDLPIQVHDLSLMLGDSIELSALASPAGNYLYEWLPDDNSVYCANCAETWVKPTDNTTYKVIVNDDLCKKEESFNIKVNTCSTTYAPQAFSPNGDSINDVFFIYGAKCVRQIKELSIFDRWGNNIFIKENIPPSNAEYGWNGTYHGQIAPPGIYTYKILIELSDGAIVKNQGAVTLLK